jgi:crossover junction endodeoxyribonuclease RuvC
VAAIRILGIDPGTQVVGFGCLELSFEAGSSAAAATAAAPLAMRASNVVRAGSGPDRLRPVECGVLRLGGRHDSVAHRLRELADRFRELVARLAPHELALEEAFYGKSAQSALRIGEARGVVLAEAARAELVIHEYAPARIKRCVTGRGDAPKDVVADMVARQLGAAGLQALAGMPRDASDALAAALTRVEERRSPLQQAAGNPLFAGGLGESTSRRRS